jgi:hypothetical protein
MKIQPLLAVILFPGYLSADSTLVTMVGVSITAYENSPEGPRSKEEIMDGRESKGADPPGLDESYKLKWMVSVPERSIGISDDEKARLVLKVWDPTWKRYPGWNPPIVEIFSGEKRVGCQELRDIGFALDVWADTQHGLGKDQKGLCISILTNERFRIAHSTHVYRLNLDSMTFRHQCSFISRDELKRESEEWTAMHADLEKKGEQAAPSNR